MARSRSRSPAAAATKSGGTPGTVRVLRPTPSGARQVGRIGARPLAPPPPMPPSATPRPRPMRGSVAPASASPPTRYGAPAQKTAVVTPAVRKTREAREPPDWVTNVKQELEPPAAEEPVEEEPRMCRIYMSAIAVTTAITSRTTLMRGYNSLVCISISL